MRVRIPLLLALGLAVALAACGPDEQDGPDLPSGAPHLRRTGRALGPHGGEATLALASPARVRILYRRDGVEERTVFDETFAGSQFLVLAYGAVERPDTTRVDPLPPIAAREEGRTEVHGFVFRIRVERRHGDLTVEPGVWTRPGRAQTRIWTLVPTRLGEAIPFGREVELATSIVADVVEGSLVLGHTDHGTTARIEPAAGPEDRLHQMRLILRVDPAGDGRSERE